MGELHLEILVERMRREFGVEATVGKPQVAFRETIRKICESSEGKFIKQSGGRGQDGHVVLKIEPLPPGSGFQFVDAVKGGTVPREFIPAVEKGIVDTLPSGVIAGYRSEEHTSELQSLMRISYAVFCLKKKNKQK